MKDLSEEELTKLREEVDNYTVEGDLRRAVSQDIKRLKDIGSYRGRRHINVRPPSVVTKTHVWELLGVVGQGPELLNLCGMAACVAFSQDAANLTVSVNRASNAWLWLRAVLGVDCQQCAILDSSCNAAFWLADMRMQLLLIWLWQMKHGGIAVVQPLCSLRLLTLIH